MLARILIGMQQKEREWRGKGLLETSNDYIEELVDCFNPQYFRLFVSVALEIGKLDFGANPFESAPSSAQSAKRILGNCLDAYISYCNENEGFGDKKNPLIVEKLERANKFKHVLNDRFRKLVGPAISETQTRRSGCTGSQELPKIEEIKKLTSWVNDARDNALNQVLATKNYDDYKNLAEATFLSILLFNRRRSSELENLELDNFRNGFEQFSEEIHPDYFKNLDQEGKGRLSTFGRMKGRGKKNSKLAYIIVDPQNAKALKILCDEEVRTKTGLDPTNKLIFGLRGKRTDSGSFVQGYPTMLKFTKQSGLEQSSKKLLRAKLLRKQVATLGLLLNLGADDVARLSSFMSHDLQIYKQYYELPSPLQHIVHITKILEKASGLEVNIEIPPDKEPALLSPVIIDVDESFTFLLDEEEVKQVTKIVETAEDEIVLAAPPVVETEPSIEDEGTAEESNEFQAACREVEGEKKFISRKKNDRSYVCNILASFSKI